jgi:YD repeat-containing protein
LTRPADVAVALDGGVYLADRSERLIHYVAPDGTVARVAGGGVATGSDGDRAVDVLLGNPTGIALGPNGDLFIAEQSAGLVRRVGVDGRIFTVAGTGFDGDLGDGGRAVEAKLINPWKVAVGRDGNVYLSELFNARIRRVSPGGVISTAVGDGGFGSPREGGLATGVSLGTPGGLELSPDGRLVFTDHTSAGVYEAGLALTGFAEDEIVIADESGAQVFVFDAAGRHLRTVHALTGADLLQFRYDDSGLLEEIENGDGLITRIERSADGEPTTILAPFGQETGLSLDPNGYLASVTNPADETQTFTYDGLGRLTAWTDALQAETTAVYDTLGRLRRETDPEGGFKQLDRSSVDRLTTAVTLTTAEGRTTRYETRRDQFATRRTVRSPEGLSRTRTTLAGGSSTLTSPDGSQMVTTSAPDPRFGMQVPTFRSQRFTFPSGLQAAATLERTIELADPANPTTINVLTDILQVNGNVYRLHFHRVTGRFTRRTPEGREDFAGIDSLGRLLESGYADFAVSTFNYDEVGRLESLTRGEGSDLRLTAFRFGPDGRLAVLTDPLGRSLSWTRDAVGRPIRFALGDGRELSFGYDANGNLTDLTTPTGSIHRFRYSSIGLLTGYDAPALIDENRSTSIEYTLDRQIEQIARPDGQEINFSYGSNGKLIGIQLPTGTIGYSYNDQGALESIRSPTGVTVRYLYDGSHRTETEWTGPIAGVVSETYNSDLRVDSQTVGDGSTTVFLYDDDNLLTRAGAMAVERDPDSGLIEGAQLGVVDIGYTFNDFEELESQKGVALLEQL